jgi:D-beta-D-heptose 7-phosphate kinase/D-beta-D-heptose 1-phosphate adenosyltransferase
MENIRKIIPKLRGKKVLVFGDLMLDEHIWSKVSRISPEAPVPIADVIQINHVPGGCGNVASNISALGGIPLLVGIIGRDSSGDKLRKALSKAKISASNIIVDPKRPTILKSRIIAGSQHVIRVDREDRSILSSKLIATIIKRLKKLVPQVDAVVVSDYGKGAVTEETAQTIISLARKFKKPVATDPKGVDYSKYKGATIVTPNLREAAIAARRVIVDEKSLIKAGSVLLRALKTEYLLVTRGRDGMSLFGKDGAAYIPAVPREVFDITGAGDTVIATLSLALAAGASMKNATILSNYAASVVVAKIGTAPCSRDELEEAIEGHEPIAKLRLSHKTYAMKRPKLFLPTDALIFCTWDM